MSTAVGWNKPAAKYQGRRHMLSSCFSYRKYDLDSIRTPGLCSEGSLLPTKQGPASTLVSLTDCFEI